MRLRLDRHATSRSARREMPNPDFERALGASVHILVVDENYDSIRHNELPEIRKGLPIPRRGGRQDTRNCVSPVGFG